MVTLKDDRLKVPISKRLIDNLILPCIAITGVGLYDLYSTGQKRFDQNIVFIIIFGVPALTFTWFIFDKRVELKDNKKVRKADRLFQLPFSSFSTPIIFIISSFFLVGGLSIIFGDKDISGGLPMLITGLLVILLISIALEHPKIWFSDTLNMEDMMENIKNTPQENFPAYQDGIFKYTNDGFVVTLASATIFALWSEIKYIKAYKVDLMTFDSIVIEVQLSETVFQVTDESPGYMKFMNTAAEKLPNFKKDWFTVVAFPAFETNLTTIYELQTASKEKNST